MCGCGQSPSTITSTLSLKSTGVPAFAYFNSLAFAHDTDARCMSSVQLSEEEANVMLTDTATMPKATIATNPDFIWISFLETFSQARSFRSGGSRLVKRTAATNRRWLYGASTARRTLPRSTFGGLALNCGAWVITHSRARAVMASDAFSVLQTVTENPPSSVLTME